ncbi:hypothetical protein SRHO_G00279940 [Serrasalmus rhombeus]
MSTADAEEVTKTDKGVTHESSILVKASPAMVLEDAKMTQKCNMLISVDKEEGQESVPNILNTILQETAEIQNTAKNIQAQEGHPQLTNEVLHTFIPGSNIVYE